MKLYSLKEAAELIGVSVRTLYIWRQHGKITFIKVGARNKVQEEEVKRICSEGVTM